MHIALYNSFKLLNKHYSVSTIVLPYYITTSTVSLFQKDSNKIQNKINAC